jgi:hypothetical protein
LKRFLLCICLALLFIPLGFAQAETAGQGAGGAQTPKQNFFVRSWTYFTTTLFAPQIHKPFSVSGGIEMTQNDRINMLPEVFIAADYELSRYFGFGLRGGFTFGSKEPADSMVSVMEGVLFGRFYVHDFGWIRPFVQTGLGISLERELEYEYTDVLGEVATGARMHWTGWFMETLVRYGYPFRMAFGVSVGHSFLP